MRLPRKVQIGDSEWSVVRLDEVAPTDEKGRVTFGYCDTESQTLEVLKGLDLLTLVATFVHEVGHAIEDEYGIKIPHRLLHALDIPIARFIIDNFL